MLREYELPFEQAEQIKSYSQYEAIMELKLPFDQAMQIEYYPQYYSMSLLNKSFEEALEIKTWNQYQALKHQDLLADNDSNNIIEIQFNSTEELNLFLSYNKVEENN